MAREASITYEQVAAVADMIIAEGGKPTLRAVRERLGRGSLGTVQKLLAQWQASHTRSAEVSMALPPAVQRSILDFMAQEVSAARSDLEQQLAEARQAAADLAAENERQAAEIEGLEQALDAERQEKSKVVGQVTQLQADLEAARAELARERQAAEGLRVELAKAELRLESVPRLEAELERLREALEAERGARHQAEVDLARMEGKR